MTLFIEDGAPVIVQGMTGHQGMTHTARMLKAGTNIVGGVNARKAGQEVNFPAAKDGEDVTLRVFGNCAEAVEVTGAQAKAFLLPIARTLLNSHCARMCVLSVRTALVCLPCLLRKV